MSRMTFLVRLLPVLVLVLGFAGTAPAATIAQHGGSASPLTEGFGFWPFNGALSVQAIPDDGGTPAWQISSTGGVQQALYIQLGGIGPYLGGSGLTQAEIDEINAIGFTLSLVARVVTGPVYEEAGSQKTSGGISVAGFTNSRFDIGLGTDGAGNTIVVVPQLISFDGSSFASAPFGSVFLVPGNDYHLYQLSYDPIAGTATLLIDGVVKATGYGGAAISGGVVDNNYGLGFGSVNLATANFAMATLESGQLPILPASPGEASGPASPMLVTGYSSPSGAISVSYGPACGAIDHTIYYGDLSQVATMSFSGQACSLGTSAAATFNPGSGSFFWVIVGNDAVVEGSYGKNSSGVERPEDSGLTTCQVPQNLTAPCD